MNATFPLGQTLITPNAANTLHPQDVAGALSRHQSGDWGEVCGEDARHNEQSLEEGTLFSIYRDRNGTKFYVITEPDHSATTVLLPEDY